MRYKIFITPSGGYQAAIEGPIGWSWLRHIDQSIVVFPTIWDAKESAREVIERERDLFKVEEGTII